MKRWIFLILGFMWVITAVAQRPVSTIRFTTTDQHPITVILNDRDFNRVGRSIMFKDLPKKRHSVQIYQVILDNKTGNKRGVKLYSGSIKLEPGKTYDAVLDMRTRKLRVKPVKILPPLAGAYTNTNRQTAPAKSSSGLTDIPVQTTEDDITIPLSFEDNLGRDVLTLKSQMDRETIDKEKIRVAVNYLDKNAVSAYEGRAILSWLLFEDSKLEMANVLKEKVTDREHLDMLADAFSFENNKIQYLNNLKK